jgi:PAS domain S-box-containing protein
MSGGIETPNTDIRSEARASVATSRLDAAATSTISPSAGIDSDTNTDFRLLAESVPQIVWVRGHDGALYFMNRRGLEYSALSFAQMALTRSPAYLVHHDDRATFEKHWNEALETGQIMAIEARLRRHDGVYRWHLIRAHPSRDANGCIVKWMGTSTDVHEARESNDRNVFLLNLTTALASYRHPQDLVCAAMARLRDRLSAARVTLAEIEAGSNNALLLTLGAGDDSQLEVGTEPLETFRELVIDSRQGVATVLCDSRSDNRTAQVYQSWYQPRSIRAMIALPLLRGGDPVAVLAVVDAQPRDWTASEIELVRRVADIVWPAFEKARADRALALSEERLRLAQSIARMGTWEWDPASNKCYFSREGHDLFGMPTSESHNFDDLLARVDSRDSLALQAALESCR